VEADDACPEETFMDEFAALAQRVVLTLDDVRGCLVLSRDGLVLGAYPEDQEAELKPAWLRFVHVGEARKGFVEFSDQLWAFVHRGPYAAFVVTGTSVRPGVMLDQLEQAVIAAEEARAKQKEVTFKVPDAAGAPSGRPRTSLHPPTDRPAAAPVASTPADGEMPSFAAPTGPDGTAAEAPDLAAADPAQADQMQAQQQRAQQPTAGATSKQAQQPLSGYRRPEAPTPPPAGDEPVGRPGAELAGGSRPSIEGSPYEAALSGEPAAPWGSETSPFSRLEGERAAAADPKDTAYVPPAANGGAFRPQPQRLASSGETDATPDADEAKEDDPAEVDRVMLAKEFSGLLQVGEDGDEN
jgi:hypothetical protein